MAAAATTLLPSGLPNESLPVAILLLGGDPERDTFAAQLSSQLPEHPVVFASSPGAGAEERLKQVKEEARLQLSLS